MDKSLFTRKNIINYVKSLMKKRYNTGTVFLRTSILSYPQIHRIC
jgi:hypothetical protein